MINRKILYGYRIRNGILEIVPEEQQTVKRIFTLYNAGASYQGISDALNQGNIPYSQEVPLWNKHKVKRLLENPRYTGQDDYPAIVDMEVFRAGRQRTAEKNEKRRPHGEKSPITYLTPYFQCTCGGKLIRIGGKWLDSDLYQQGLQVHTGTGNASGFDLLELWSLRGQQPAHETRCFAEGNTDISAPISEISAMAVIMFPEKPGTV